MTLVNSFISNNFNIKTSLTFAVSHICRPLPHPTLLDGFTSFVLLVFEPIEVLISTPKDELLSINDLMHIFGLIYYPHSHKV